MPGLESLFMYITARCNMRCPHCWIVANNSARDETDSCSYLQVLEQASHLGLKRVKITGGEPLIREEIVASIVRWCAERGVVVHLETNGFLLRRQHVSWLRHLGEMLVSLDYDDAASFDAFRACEGAFSGAMDAIDIALNADVRVTVAMTVMDDNIRRVPAVASLLFDVLELSVSLKLNPCITIGRAKTGTTLRSDGFLTFVRAYHDVARRYPGKVVASVPAAFSHPFVSPGPRSRCDYRSLLSVCPDGDISVCGLAITNPSASLGNMRNVTIGEVWAMNDSLQRLHCVSGDTAKGVCSLCILKSECVSPCPAYSFDTYGDWDSPFPTCQRLYEAGLFPTEFIGTESGR